MKRQLQALSLTPMETLFGDLLRIVFTNKEGVKKCSAVAFIKQDHMARVVSDLRELADAIEKEI